MQNLLCCHILKNQEQDRQRWACSYFRKGICTKKYVQMINDFTTFCTTPRTRRQYGSCNWILEKNYRANIYNYLFVGSFHILTQTIFFLIYTCPKWKQWEKSGIYITRQFMAIQNSGLDNNQVKWIHRRLETFKVIVSTFF